MAQFRSDADIEQLVSGFLDCSLPESEWTHAAHFAAALWLLRTRGSQAFVDMPPLIRAYNLSIGGQNTESAGYHETITVASLRAAQAHLARRPGAALHEVLAELLATPVGRSDWLLAYWSRPMLFSAVARRDWVEPDLEPLPY